MTHDVAIHPLARDDLFDLYAYIAQESGLERAGHFVGRIERACQDLALFPERGKRRNEIAPGLRTISLERRVLIAFRIDGTTVNVLRVLYGGRDFARDDVPG